VIDIIFGDVFVVVAKFFATDVVTLRCNRESDMTAANPGLGNEAPQYAGQEALDSNHSVDLLTA